MIRGKLISSPEQLKLIDKNSEMFKILHKDSVKFTVMDSFIRSGGKEYRDDLKTKQLKFLYENAEGNQLLIFLKLPLSKFIFFT